MVHGYGKWLDVDLTSRSIEKKDIDPEFTRKYLGGVGFGCQILYDEIGPLLCNFAHAPRLWPRIYFQIVHSLYRN